MPLNLFKKRRDAELFAIYGRIVEQARRPRFYADWGVADTVTGRFDMICLHLALVFRRLRGEATARDFAQDLFDLFFKDMDRSLREMGAGDLAVPKKIQKMGSLFYGLLASLDTALKAEDAAAVADVLRRNIYEEAASAGAVSALADYLIEEARHLAAQPISTILDGRLEWSQIDEPA
jgi:cytochrome b pre-mRNA-processing protein 3